MNRGRIGSELNLGSWESLAFQPEHVPSNALPPQVYPDLDLPESHVGGMIA